MDRPDERGTVVGPGAKYSDGAQARRLQAAAQAFEDHRPGEAAVCNGMDPQIPCDWVQRYNPAGVDG